MGTFESNTYIVRKKYIFFEILAFEELYVVFSALPISKFSKSFWSKEYFAMYTKSDVPKKFFPKVWANPT